MSCHSCFLVWENTSRITSQRSAEEPTRDKLGYMVDELLELESTIEENKCSIFNVAENLTSDHRKFIIQVGRKFTRRRKWNERLNPHTSEHSNHLKPCCEKAKTKTLVNVLSIFKSIFMRRHSTTACSLVLLWLTIELWLTMEKMGFLWNDVRVPEKNHYTADVLGTDHHKLLKKTVCFIVKLLNQ